MFEPAFVKYNDSRRETSQRGMDSDDACILAKQEEKPATIKRNSGSAKLRITLLTDDENLVSRLEHSLGVLQANIMRVETIDRTKKLIDSGQSDITIVDVQRAGVWPACAFQLFDELADRDLIVILCRDAGDVRNYRERSLHAFDIFPIGAIDDHRFQWVIHAALLRAEALPQKKNGDDANPCGLRSLVSSLPAFCD